MQCHHWYCGTHLTCPVAYTILFHIPYCSAAQVYRMASADIGCSLAEAAESPAYESYLTEASHTPNSLHVVYINTSLRTKAVADQMVPTITCTSSNVVQTILQGFAQVRAEAAEYVQKLTCVCGWAQVWFGVNGCCSVVNQPADVQPLIVSVF